MAAPHDTDDNNTMPNQSLRIFPSTGAGCPRYCRGQAAANALIRHHLHQHKHWKNDGYPGQNICPERTDKVGLHYPNKGLNHQNCNGRQGQAHLRPAALEVRPPIPGHRGD